MKRKELAIAPGKTGRKGSRKDGLLELRFNYNKKRYSVYGSSDDELISKGSALYERLEGEAYTPNKDLTLDQFFAEFIESKRKKANTIRSYESTYEKHIKSMLGNKKLSEIETRECLRVRAAAEKKDLSVTTQNYIITVLRIIFNAAVKQHIVDWNPAKAIDRIEADTSATDPEIGIHRALKVEEQTAFMTAARGDFYYEFLAFLLSTGVRTGEASALRWSCVDYDQGVIHIQQTITIDRAYKRTEGTPKTKTSKRDIDLTVQIRELLETQREKMRLLTGVKPGADDYVFLSTYQKPVSTAVINKAINRILRKLEKNDTHIERFAAHALRDTYATRCIEQGMSPQTLKVILGHAHIAMTMDKYAQVLAEQRKEEIKKVSIAI